LRFKVDKESEGFFNDQFWGKLDFVVCAVDNLAARRYIDDQCVWYEKAMF
jgi:ubiquitin-activating enzyme E1